MVHLDGYEFYELEIERDRVFHLRLILKELVSRLLLLLSWAGTTEREGLIIIKGFPDGQELGANRGVKVGRTCIPNVDVALYSVFLFSQREEPANLDLDPFVPGI